MKIQFLDTFLRELINKLVAVLRADSFKSNSLDCSGLLNGTTDVSATFVQNEPTAFENRMAEAFNGVPLIQMYSNSTFKVEYYLKMMVFGREDNTLQLPADISPVLTELAMIDNTEFNIKPNISIKAPRRFFRVGVAHVIERKYYTFHQHFEEYQKKSEQFVNAQFSIVGNPMVLHENRSKNIEANPRWEG